MLIVKTKNPLPHGSQFVTYKGYLLLLNSKYPSYYIAQILDIPLCLKLLDFYQEIKDTIGINDPNANFMKYYRCNSPLPNGPLIDEEDYNFRYIGETLNGASLHIGRGRVCVNKKANNNDVDIQLLVVQHGNNYQSIYIPENATYKNPIIDQLEDRTSTLDLSDEQIEFIVYKENAESYCIIDSSGINSYTYSQAIDLVAQKKYSMIGNEFSELNQEHYQYMSTREKKYFRNERCLSPNTVAFVNSLFNLKGGC